jgi:hypothetical protein
MMSKRVETKVTNADLAHAQGGEDRTGIVYRLTVECPDNYDAEDITAEDIVHDDQIRVVG